MNIRLLNMRSTNKASQSDKWIGKLIFVSMKVIYSNEGGFPMKILSIEPTPSPHSMKINVNKRLPDDETLNFKLGDDISTAPDYINSLFKIEGITNIYRVVDFITIARHPRIAWEKILPVVRETLGTEEKDSTIETAPKQAQADTSFGEVRVFIQMFRGIPMQVKLEEGDEETRVGLPELFTNAILKASPASPNIIWERKWVEQHVRYGTVNDIGREVVEELAASYDQERLDKLVELAFEEQGTDEIEKVNAQNKITLETLDNPDWRVRYAALDRLMNPTLKDLPVLDKALDDERSSIRRLATAYLGMIEEPEVLPSLYKALKDKASNVRRTAGDCLSDLGFKEAMPEMIATLTDDNRIVRWRAAMFLYEIGDETAIPALKNALDDPEFEVRMQVNMALERIERGEEAEGSIWHQMIQATRE